MKRVNVWSGVQGFIIPDQLCAVILKLAKTLVYKRNMSKFTSYINSSGNIIYRDLNIIESVRKIILQSGHVEDMLSLSIGIQYLN